MSASARRGVGGGWLGEEWTYDGGLEGVGSVSGRVELGSGGLEGSNVVDGDGVSLLGD